MLDEKELLAKLRKAKAKKALIQVPEGLKGRASAIAGSLEKNGIGTVISVEPCFGSCDLRDGDALDLGCDALVHIGHNDLGLKSRVPVIYDEYEMDFDPVTLLMRNVDKLKGFKRIGLVTTIQHLNALPTARTFLEKVGREVTIPESKRLKPGQILGCDRSAAESIEYDVDCFLFIGSGRFHPLGLAATMDVPVFFLDAENGTLSEMSRERCKLKIMKQLRVEKAKGLRNFGIFVSTKPGQSNIGEAERLKEALLKKGKNAFIISANMLTPEKIMGMGIEVLVNTGCPRIYDDQELFGMVILNPIDIEAF